MVTSQRPKHRYLLDPCDSIYVPDLYRMLPPLWDGFLPRVESLKETALEVTTLLVVQAVELDIIERGKPCAPNINTSESGINPIVVVQSTHLSINPISLFLHIPFRLLRF